MKDLFSKQLSQFYSCCLIFTLLIFIAPSLAHSRSLLPLKLQADLSNPQQPMAKKLKLEEPLYLDQSGFTELIANSAFWTGLWFFAGISSIFPHDPIRAIWAPIVGVGLGATLPWLIGHKRAIPMALTRYVNNLTLLGLQSGLLIAILVGSKDTSIRTLYNYAALGSFLGYGTGLASFAFLKITPGQSDALLVGQIYGGLLGLFVWQIAEGKYWHNNMRSHYAAASILSGSWLLSTLALVLKDHLEVDRSRWTWSSLGAAGGWVFSLALARMFNGNSLSHVRSETACWLTGTAAGALAGYLISDTEDSYKKKMPLTKTYAIHIPHPILLRHEQKTILGWQFFSGSF